MGGASSSDRERNCSENTKDHCHERTGKKSGTVSSKSQARRHNREKQVEEKNHSIPWKEIKHKEKRETRYTREKRSRPKGGRLQGRDIDPARKGKWKISECPTSNGGREEGLKKRRDL